MSHSQIINLTLVNCLFFIAFSASGSETMQSLQFQTADCAGNAVCVIRMCASNGIQQMKRRMQKGV